MLPKHISVVCLGYKALFCKVIIITISCTNGNLQSIFIGRAQLGRHISVLNYPMAIIEKTCEGCKFDYWEVITKFHSKDDLCY